MFNGTQHLGVSGRSGATCVQILINQTRDRSARRILVWFFGDRYMNNFDFGDRNLSAPNAPHTTNASSSWKFVAAFAAIVLFLLFTGLLITTTLLYAERQAANQPQVPTDKLQTARVQPITIAPEDTLTSDSVAEVSRGNAGIANEAELAKATAPADDVMETAFDAAEQEAALAALRVAELEKTFSLPDCVAELQNLVKTVRIGFASGSSEPLPEDMAGARRIASVVSTCEPVMVAVEGHSDLTGQEQDNMKLSWIRADAVVNRLRGEGFDVSALEPLGFGARKPIDAAVTPTANALNRRVQFHLAPRPGTDAALFANN